MSDHAIDQAMREAMSRAGMSESHFFSVGDWEDFFGIKLPHMDLSEQDKTMARVIGRALLKKSPFSTRIVAKDYALVYTPTSIDGQRLTLVELDLLLPRKKGLYLLESEGAGGVIRFADCRFVRTTTRYHWLLVYIGVVPETTDKKWLDQAERVRGAAHHDIPSAVEILAVHAMLGMKSGVRLAKNLKIRTSDEIGSDRLLVSFSEAGIRLASVSDEIADESIGAAAIFKHWEL